MYMYIYIYICKITIMKDNRRQNTKYVFYSMRVLAC